MNTEIRDVREELDWQRGPLLNLGSWRYGIHLPRKVELTITAKEEHGRPIYTYRDLNFQDLDQDEIQKLLMGESLYGDPDLCIRAALQNALDALELRDLRLKMLDILEQGQTPVEAIDPLPMVRGERKS